MSNLVGLAMIAGLADTTVDYNYPPPVNYQGIALLVGAVTAMLTVILPFILVLMKRTAVLTEKIRETHDLVNGMSEEKDRERREKVFAEGKLAGGLEERAARAPPAAQMPQPPIPKE